MKSKFLLLSLAGFALAGCAHHNALVPPEDSAYKKPLFSPGQKFGGLPASVQNTVRAQAGAAEIDDVNKEIGPSGEPVYIITFHKSTIYAPLYVGTDGSVLNPDMTIAVSANSGNIGVATSGPMASLRLSDLPPGAVKRIQEHAPDAEIGHISREVHGDKIFYAVQFKDESRHPAIYVGADGALLTEPPH
jgi:hypothetical protein